nr:type II CAAX endopeptidase family protein [uncultured Holophaga sp.]
MTVSSPSHRRADGLILLLVLLAFLTTWANLHRRMGTAPSTDQVSLQGRALDLQLSISGHLGPGMTAASSPHTSWDWALLAIQKAEAGHPEAATPVLDLTPRGFAQVWRRAYAQGPSPAPEQVETARRALARTHAGGLLEARLQEADGKSGAALRQAADARLYLRLGLLALVGLGALAAFAGGLGFILFLSFRKRSPLPQLPALSLGGRSLAILFLAWFLVMQVSGTLIQALCLLLPFLRPWTLPLAYLLHALFAVGLLCHLEGIPFRELWRRMTSGPPGRSLLWGLGHLGMTVVLALALSLILGFLLKDSEPPQRELIELLNRASTPGTVIPLFLTVAVLAPCFEELLFRGCLIPALRRRMPLWVALAVGGIAFGAMHLQPAGLPLLSLLGITMGLAFVRTGNLWSSILVHGLWNAAQFLLMRALY